MLRTRSFINPIDELVGLITNSSFYITTKYLISLRLMSQDLKHTREQLCEVIADRDYLSLHVQYLQAQLDNIQQEHQEQIKELNKAYQSRQERIDELENEMQEMVNVEVHSIENQYEKHYGNIDKFLEEMPLLSCPIVIPRTLVLLCPDPYVDLSLYEIPYKDDVYNDVVYHGDAEEFVSEIEECVNDRSESLWIIRDIANALNSIKVNNHTSSTLWKRIDTLMKLLVVRPHTIITTHSESDCPCTLYVKDNPDLTNRTPLQLHPLV